VHFERYDPVTAGWSRQPEPEDSRYRQSAGSTLWCLKNQTAAEADKSGSSLEYGGSSKRLRQAAFIVAKTVPGGRTMKATCGLFQSRPAVFMPFVSDASSPLLIAVSYSLKPPGVVAFVSSCSSEQMEWRMQKSEHRLLIIGGCMSSIAVTRFTPAAEVISNILNWVCPECGGRMGGEEGLEFKCQGRCRTDWRELWNSVR